MLDSDSLKKLFFYCLKRTGNRTAAEDLSGDISLEILTMLNRGYKPENFNGWMWAVARTKYAAWAKKKKIFSQNMIVGDMPIDLASCENIENDIVQNETIAFLRRELSIMSKEYREITVAYYMENRKIADIAKSVNLPEGTIKRKLSESRKYLREGINMMRTYGKRSYSPDDINLISDGQFTEDNVPNSLIGSKLAKNILLEAYANPCTIEELAVALGVAAPYLEEEVDKLVEGLLLTKIKGGKYETDFIILDKETQEAIIAKTVETAEKIASPIFFTSSVSAGLPVLIETLSVKARNLYQTSSPFTVKYIQEILGLRSLITKEEWSIIEEIFKTALIEWKTRFPNNKTTPGEISCEDSMWFYLFKSVRDMLLQIRYARDEILWDYPKNYKGEWNLTGFEEYPENELLNYAVEVDWNRNEAQDKHIFKFSFNGFSSIKPTLRDFELLTDILKHDKNYDSISENEKGMVQELTAKGLTILHDNTIKPTFPIWYMQGLEEIVTFTHHPSYPEQAKKYDEEAIRLITETNMECMQAIIELFDYNLKQITCGLPKRLNRQAKYCARDMLSYLHNAIFKTITEKNYLPAPDKVVGIGGYVN
ncbi:MAG: sigma-70 family RNA polymerase sigma factor [Firmicutes bacterium]|nr:sigma-70 family RNA polymerase sigma factor [Bacillota bacterium]